MMMMAMDQHLQQGRLTGGLYERKQEEEEDTRSTAADLYSIPHLHCHQNAPKHANAEMEMNAI
jgi:hypothetical protein